MSERRYPEQTIHDLKDESFGSFLDLARWFAATVVFLGHLRNPTFFGYGALTPDERNPAVFVWYFLTGYHYVAVLVFFVLSGYLVGGLNSARASIGKFDLSGYAIDRVTRLYVAFFPALVLTVLLDTAGSAWFQGSGIYNQTHPQILEKIAVNDFAGNTTFELFMSNLFMLQHFFTQTLGSNQPLWTISAEFWFYAVFGLVMLAAFAKDAWPRYVAIAILAAAFVALGTKFVLLLGLWLVGVAAAFIPGKRLERPVTAFAVFATVLLVYRINDGILDKSEFLRTLASYAIALTFGWVLVSMRSVRLIVLVKLAGFNKVMADFSYSLYLIHFPLMLFCLGALHATGSFDTIAQGYRPNMMEGVLVYILVAIAVYSTAYVFSLVTEKQTWRVRQALKAAISKG